MSIAKQTTRALAELATNEEVVFPKPGPNPLMHAKDVFTKDSALVCLTFFVAFPALLADKANDNNLGKREKELVKVEDESGQMCVCVCVQLLPSIQLHRLPLPK